LCKSDQDPCLPLSMVFRRKKFVRRRRPVRRRRVVRRRVVRRRSIPRSPFSAVKLVKLKYADILNFSVPAAPSIGYTRIRCNSIFDPDYDNSGTNHQPMFRDELAAIYNHYQVLGAKINVKFMANDKAQVCGIYVDDDAAAPAANISRLMEQKKAQWRLLGSGSTTPYGQRPVSLTHKWSARKFLGRALANQASSSAAVGSNPTEDVFFMLFCAATTDLDDPGSQQVIINVEYIVRFSEMTTVAQS